jgi:ATP-dependent Clp protease ATP-binding subunit ClpC
MKQAGIEAMQLKQNYISTEHLLLGVINNSDNGASQVLKAMNIDADALRLDIEKFAPMGDNQRSNIPDRPHPSPRAKKVIENSLEEARLSFNDIFIRSEYILLGLLREEDTPAAQVLMNHGLRLEQVRDKIREVYRQSEKK